MPSDLTSLRSLKNLIAEADLILETAPSLPENRTAAAREALNAALVLTQDLIKQSGMSPAVALGHKGGSATALKFGPDHFRQLAAKRKNRNGGRPPKLPLASA